MINPTVLYRLSPYKQYKFLNCAHISPIRFDFLYRFA